MTGSWVCLNGNAGDECGSVTPARAGSWPSFIDQQTHLQQIHWIERTCEAVPGTLCWAPSDIYTSKWGGNNDTMRTSTVCSCRQVTFQQQDILNPCFLSIRNQTTQDCTCCDPTLSLTNNPDQHGGNIFMSKWRQLLSWYRTDLVNSNGLD